MPYVHKLTYISLIIRDYQVFLIPFLYKTKMNISAKGN